VTVVPSSDDEVVERDFFISYNQADRAWAEWIAWQLEDAGYTTVLQAWDFVPGSNFVVEMDKAAQVAKRTIAVLSPSYVAAAFTQPEWASAFAGDPTGAARKLVPVRVTETERSGLLSQIVFIDLVGLSEDEARERLLAGIRDRLKPTEPPVFPGGAHAGETSPEFPGVEKPEVPASSDVAVGGKTWVKINDLIFGVDELDDAGEVISLKGRLDEDVSRRLDGLRESGYGNTRVRFVSATRVADAELKLVRRTTRAGQTETVIELERAESARFDPLRAGTSGMSPDDLVEAGMRRLFLGEPLDSSLRMMDFLTDPGLDREALSRAFVLDDNEVAQEVVRLLVNEGLVGSGHAQAVTRVEVGPRLGDARSVAIEWLPPRVYSNVEPTLRQLTGTWRVA
jgi:hypothetical protein